MSSDRALREIPYPGMETTVLYRSGPKHSSVLAGHWCFLEGAVILADADILRGAGISAALVLDAGHGLAARPVALRPETGVIPLPRLPITYLDTLYDWGGNTEEFALRALVPRPDSARGKLAERGGGVEATIGKWQIVTSGSPPQSVFDFGNLLLDEAPPGQAGRPEAVYAEVYLGSKPGSDDVVEPVARAWQQVIGPCGIPYDLEERRETLAHAYEELDEYIRKWEAPSDEAS